MDTIIIKYGVNDDLLIFFCTWYPTKISSSKNIIKHTQMEVVGGRDEKTNIKNKHQILTKETLNVF